MQTTLESRTVSQVSEQEPTQEPTTEFQSFSRLQDYTPFSYEVLFTQPDCGLYEYKSEVKSRSNKVLKNKPKNAFCKSKYDYKKSADRMHSPQFRLIEWILSPDVKEIFFSFFSFRNKEIKEALCLAAKNEVKISFIISKGEDQTTANELVNCNPAKVQFKTRGLSRGLGYGHNKFLIINPQSRKEIKIVFSSGNLTSGPVLHHENWNFIKTYSGSHFAQAHLCAMQSSFDDDKSSSLKKYSAAIYDCRKKIVNPVESDIKVFFIPGEGEPHDDNASTDLVTKTASEFLIQGDSGFPGINNAKKIWLACHRFYYDKMINALNQRMTSDAKPEFKILADDDTFYKVYDASFTSASTQKIEFYKMRDLFNLGAQLKFLETNSLERLLHHSKFLIFADESGFKSVFTGSANLTKAGFNQNFENSYFVTIPSVVESYVKNYDHIWSTMASEMKDLPKKAIMNNKINDQPTVRPTEVTSETEGN